MAALGILLTGCDKGPFHDASTAPPAVNLLVAGTNVGPGVTFTVDQPIRLAFDRFLDANTVTRQSILLEDSGGNLLTDELIAYDPVTLTVTLADPGLPLPWLTVGQDYRVVLNVPSTTGGNPGGLRAVDGAPLASPVTVLFTAEAAPAGATGATGATGTIHTVDFCTEILAPLLTPVCAGCHGPSTPSNPSVTGGHPPLGLDLSSAAGLRTTAIGQVADESNVGPLAQPASQPAGTPFGVDMPIITAGEPGNSWLLYKTLLAIPAAGDAGAEASALPTASSDERARLGELILGQAMPYPSTPTAGELAASPLTVEQLETLSAWIAQGAVTPASCP